METLQTKKKARLLEALATARVTLFKLLSNKNRIKILYRLYESNQNWSSMYDSTRMNPKLLRDHLNYLIRYEIVEKENNLYKLTPFGRSLCELNFFIKPNDISEVAAKMQSL